MRCASADPFRPTLPRLLVGLAAAAWGADARAQAAPPTPEEVFLWAYPLVVTARTVGDLPRNELRWHAGLPTPDDRTVPRPNPDLLYGVAALDLAAGPVFLDVPDLEDRYWSVHVMDPWTETVGYLGTRATESGGGVWMLLGPDDDTPAPPGAQPWRMPSTGMVVLVRLGVTGPEDEPAALALRDQFVITSSATPPPPPGSAGSALGAGQNGIAFWDEVGAALAWASPVPEEADRVATLATFGVGPGMQPSVEVTAPRVRRGLTYAVDAGAAVLEAAVLEDPGPTWSFDLGLGTYGDDWLLRAETARTGWGANTPDEAVYTGAVLTGPTLLRFEPHELPPVDAFWSVAVYDHGGRLYDNPWGRYSLQSSHPWLVPEADGAVEILFATEPPVEGTDNWLPIPPEPAMMVLRLYLPGPSVLDGTWQPPDLVRLPPPDPPPGDTGLP